MTLLARLPAISILSVLIIATDTIGFTITSTMTTKGIVRRSSSLGEIQGESYYHADTNSNAKWRRRPRARGDASPLNAIADTSASQDEEPKLSFGVIADIQYAPIEDGESFGGVPRFYRHALSAARHAAKHFQEEKVDLMINLGDIVDGKCQEIEPTEETKSRNPGIDAIRDVMEALSAYTHGEILHTYGNHELYNVDRKELGNLLSIPFHSEPCGEQVGYRSRLVEKNGVRLRFVVLDTYDIALGGRCENSSTKRKLAEALLEKNNPNFSKGNENSPEGMEGLMRRFVAFNGAIGEIQMQWLRDTLEAAKQSNEKVIILSHQPLLPDSSNAVCLAWNYDEILDLLKDYSGTVIASFSGHAHRGGYKRCDESGIHYRVFEAALESPDPIKTYAIVDLYDDRIVVRGSGDCTSAIYTLDHMN
jgi:manganese-dependent ADP-ribose/CDP-alcohol diphosphatase